MHPNKSQYSNIILLIFSIIFILTLAEITIRLVYPVPNDYDLKNYFRPDDASGFDIAENIPKRWHNMSGYKYQIWSNELGCFDKAYKGEKDYTLLVGDSFTWGYVPFECKYGTFIEDYLGSRVLNCGVMACGTKQELIKIRKIVEKTGNTPKLIIIGYLAANDCLDDFIFPGFTVMDGYLVLKTKLDGFTGQKRVFTDEEVKQEVKKYYHPLPYTSILDNIKWWLKRYSTLYNIVYNNKNIRLAADKLGLTNKAEPIYPSETFLPIKEHPWLWQAWKENFNNLREAKELSYKYGAKLLIVLIPAKEEVYDFFKTPGYDWEAPNKIIQGFLKDEGIDYLDLTPSFKLFANQNLRKHLNPQKDLYWGFDNHWSIKGNRLAALLITRHIIDHNLIEITEKDRIKIQIEQELNKFLITR